MVLDLIDDASIIITRFFNHAVEGFDRSYPRSLYEMGLGTSVGVLVAVIFEEIPTVFWLGMACGIAWLGFYLRAFIYTVPTLSRKADVDYDRRGKYKLPKEYHESESATCAKAKTAKSKR